MFNYLMFPQYKIYSQIHNNSIVQPADRIRFHQSRPTKHYGTSLTVNFMHLRLGVQVG